jgi:hypothetical protein
LRSHSPSGRLCRRSKGGEEKHARDTPQLEQNFAARVTSAPEDGQPVALLPPSSVFANAASERSKEGPGTDNIVVWISQVSKNAKILHRSLDLTSRRMEVKCKPLIGTGKSRISVSEEGRLGQKCSFGQLEPLDQKFGVRIPVPEPSLKSEPAVTVSGSDLS